MLGELVGNDMGEAAVTCVANFDADDVFVSGRELTSRKMASVESVLF
jgi:hypothetical protein